MILGNRIKYLLPFSFVIGSFADIQLTSYVGDGGVGAFSNSWLYLIPVILLVFSIIYYFYVWRRGRCYVGKKQNESKLLFVLKSILSVIGISIVFAYIAFHIFLWAATYIPGVPTKTQNLIVLKKHEANNGRYMITSKDSNGNTVYPRFAWIHPYFEEGDLITLRCKDVKWVCRINGIQVKESK